MLQVWTTSDFENLCWHDCRVYGFRIGEVHDERGTAELELDIDYLVEWLCTDAGRYKFRVAPATLTFHEVFGFRIEIDYAAPTAGMSPFSIDGVKRVALSSSMGITSYRWQLPINWPDGEITFESPGFTQVLKREPIETDRQFLTPSQRSG
jgi:hypothetical protein